MTADLIATAERTVAATSVPSQVYLVTYTAPHPLGAGEEERVATVHLIEGYSTYESIRSILAVREWCTNRPEAVAKITVVSTVLLASQT